MTDKEKVIAGLKCCLEPGAPCQKCPYYDEDCTDKLERDALDLLKEQEAKTVLYRKERSVNPGKALSGFCPKCSHTLIYGMNKHFCGNCGQEVKWE